MKKLVVLFTLIVLATSVKAIELPLPSESGVTFEITQPPKSDVFGNCPILYAERGSYCSGSIRQYEQCIPISDSQARWEARSENCANYDYVCFAGDCTEPSIPVYFVIYVVPFIIVAIIIMIIWKVRKRR